MTVSEELAEYLRQAIDLRHGEAGDPEGKLLGAKTETIPQVLNLMTRLQMRAERLDEIQTKVFQLRSRVRLISEDAKFQAETAMFTATQSRSARKGEFTSAREVEADAKLDSFKERKLAHELTQTLERANVAVEIITQLSRQLSNYRSDLRARLHALQFEASL